MESPTGPMKTSGAVRVILALSAQGCQKQVRTGDAVLGKIGITMLRLSSHLTENSYGFQPENGKQEHVVSKPTYLGHLLSLFLSDDDPKKVIFAVKHVPFMCIRQLIRYD